MPLPKSPLGVLKPQSKLTVDPFLRVYSQGQFVRSFQIQPGTQIVGRDPQASICIKDQFVSRRHFQVEYERPNQLYIQDLQSHNGTFLNGESIQRAALAHGDRIQVGQFEVVVSHPSKKEPKVIPFPKIRTDPALQPPPVQPVPKPQTPPAQKRSLVSVIPPREAKPKAQAKAIPERRALISTLYPVFRVSMVVGAAAALAWTGYQWNIQSKLRSFLSVLTTPSSTEEFSLLGKEVSQERVSKPLEESGVGKDQSILKPKGVEEKARATKRSKKTGVIIGLDRSLDQLMGGDLKAADRLVAPNLEDRMTSEKARKRVKAPKLTSMAIEVTMPRPEDFAAHLDDSGRIKSKNKKSQGFDPKKYQKMLRGKITGVETCYANHALEGGQSGKVSVWFSIASSGEVQKTGLDSTSFKNPALEKCILDRIQKLKFDPPPWDGFTITYTFRFGRRQRIQFG